MADEKKVCVWDADKHDDGAIYGGDNQRAPASAAELEQIKANKAKHSERVLHGGKPR